MPRPWNNLRRILSLPTRPRTIVRPRPRTRPNLECLEDRTVPTVIFNSALGGDTIQWLPGNTAGQPDNQVVTSPIAHNPTALQNPTVYFIFQGTSWTQTNAGARAGDAQTIIQSPYLSKLTDYGSTGTAVYGGYTIDNTAAPTPNSDPNKQQSQFINAAQTEIQTIVPNMSSWTKPKDQNAVDSPVYIVVFDTGFTDSAGNHKGGEGWNGAKSYNSNLTMNEIFIAAWGGDQDAFTDTFSHEIVERIFTGSGSGLTMNASADAMTDGEFQNAQIGDNEPDQGNYTYRLDGSLQVQAYWSLSAPNSNGLNGGVGAFVVPDSIQQDFYLDPQWNFTGYDSQGLPQYSYTKNIQLMILGASQGNTINLSTTSNGGVQATLNGGTESFDSHFEPDLNLTGVIVQPGAGSSAVNVLATPSGISTFIEDQGNDSVVVGNYFGSVNDGAGYLGNIQGLVAVAANGDIGEPGATYLYLDDSGDHARQTVNMYDGEIDYGAAAPIYYNPSSASTGDVTYLAVYGGSSDNTFFVDNTSNLYNDTFLSTGTGNDTVNVFATKGGLYVDNRGGNDKTDLGAGYTGGLNGFVHVGGDGSTSLYVDDTSDTTNRTVTMDDYSISGLGMGGIYWSPTSSSTGGVTYVEVDGGHGNDIFNVNNTGNLYKYTLLKTNIGNDTVNVYGTQGGLDVDNPGGFDVTNIGLGNMGSINGSVDVYGSGTTELSLDDSSDTTARTVTLNDGSITGLGGGTGTISWTPTASSTGGVDDLNVYGSEGGSTYDINNTSNIYVGTFLSTGTGNDTVNVSATKGSSTTGGLNVFNRGGDDSVDVGLGSVANIKGIVYASGYGATALLVDDHLDSTSRTATITGVPAESQVTGLGNAGIITCASGVTGVTIDGPSKASTYNIQSTSPYIPVTITGGAGNDTFTVGSGNSLDGIQGALTINGAGGTNTLIANDSSSAGGQSYSLSKTALARSGIASIAYTSVSALKITGSGDDTLTLLNPVPTVATTFNGGSGTNTLQGANVSNSWAISGANSGKLDSVSFSNFQKLVGGTGVDVFNFRGTSATVLSISGGGAPARQGNWLNYSALPSTSTVTVNLATGSATNVNSGAAGAVTNIQNVIGSAGATNDLTGDSQGNILIGGSGANTLTGGSGGSLLIGGSGQGSITGGASTDILIAGTTTYNATTTAGQNALMAILAELQSADTFAQKVADILNGNKSGGGSDLNGTNKLTWGGSSPTVKASTGAFTLSGDTSAAAADWFFSNASSTVTDFNDDGVMDEHNNNAIGVF